ncbi:MAG: ABC transporter permease subunit, partial [Spongiibacteraceae bacterium]
EVGFRLDTQGMAQFFNVADGELLQEHQLGAGANSVQSFALNSEGSRLFALGLATGDVVIAKHDYRISYPNDKRLIKPYVNFPYGEQPRSLIEGFAVEQLAISDNDDALLLVGSHSGQLYAKRWTKEENFLSEEIVLSEERLLLPAIDIVPQELLISPDQHWLYLIAASGEYRLINLRSSELENSGYLFSGGELSSARFLLGGISLMVANNRGEISQWFTVRVDEDSAHYKLEQVRSFEMPQQTGSAALVSEHRRKGFVAVTPSGQLNIFHATSERHLLSEELGISNVASMAISPRANALLIESTDGQMHSYKLHNEHPELSWTVLWSEVWYESYPEPDYVWQSSSASNDFEAKYSFAPLTFGTLKAAFYAMLIAAPLAICGAIYTAYFMAPALRRKIKPLIELMEALPTVILGFLAGLWLAPFIEKNLPAVFSIFLTLPLGILLFAWLWERLPLRIRGLLPEGWHPVVLVPVIIFIVGACVTASAPMEKAFFGGDMRAWLTNDLGLAFDQRNALVVGIAMGFAVIPTIFSIAEDAIFSVPKHLSYGSLALGATPWQSLVGVVMPTASPGIFSALMIGMGRAVGETMIVLMATGNTPIMDANIFEGMRTLAANIAVEIGETEVDSTHFRVLFLAAFVLFLFTFVVNTVAEVVRQRLRTRYGNL